MTKAAYFIAETDANGWVNNTNRWTQTKACTLAAAKRAASRAQMFQGTAMFVGEMVSGRIVEVAVKRDDPINMNIKGCWSRILD